MEAFLAAAADDYEAAVQALEILRQEHSRVTASLLEARDHEREVARVLSAAEQSAQQILEQARQRAGERVSAAESAVQELLREGAAERERILAEIAGCRDRQARLVRVLETEIAGLQQPATPDATVAAVVAEDARPEASGELPAATAGEADAVGVTASPLYPAIAADQNGELIDATRAPAPRPADVVDTPRSPREAIEAAAATGEPGTVDEPSAALDPVVESIPALAEPPTIAERSHGRGHRILVAASVAAIAIVSVAAIPWLRASDAPTQVPSAPAPVSVAPQRTVSVPEPAVPSESSPSAPQSAAAPASDTITVRLEATSPCWLRLTFEGRSEEYMLEAGDTLDRTAVGDVVLRTGNAGALQVTVDGRAIPPLGREGEVVTRRITRPISLDR